ncbi:hypothetical protein [Streptomyces sp. NPDC050264]|uniref:hypothetical protein n=1 Tax=Streptomyces sp. NPDC050264 TaxID=3155038 RepID=UPI003432EE65
MIRIDERNAPAGGKRVHDDRGGITATDGPFTETKEVGGGYAIAGAAGAGGGGAGGVPAGAGAGPR